MTASLQLLGGGWLYCSIPTLLGNEDEDEGASEVASGKHCHAGKIIIQVSLDAFKFQEV